MTSTAAPTTPAAPDPSPAADPAPTSKTTVKPGAPTRRRLPREVLYAGAPVGVGTLTLTYMAAGWWGVVALIGAGTGGTLLWIRMRRGRGDVTQRARDAATRASATRPGRAAAAATRKARAALARMLPAALAARITPRAGRVAGGPGGGLAGAVRNQAARKTGLGLAARAQGRRAATRDTARGANPALGGRRTRHTATAPTGRSSGRTTARGSGPGRGATGGGRASGSGRGRGRAPAGRNTGGATGRATGGATSSGPTRRPPRARTRGKGPSKGRWRRRSRSATASTTPTPRRRWWRRLRVEDIDPEGAAAGLYDPPSDPYPDDFPDTTPDSTGETHGETPKSGEPPRPDETDSTGSKGDTEMPDYTSAVTGVTTATEARQVLTQMPERLAEQVTALQAQHAEISENVALNPEVEEAMSTFATTARMHADSYSEVAETLLTSHAEDFERIERGTDADAAWDVSRNRGTA